MVIREIEVAVSARLKRGFNGVSACGTFPRERPRRVSRYSGAAGVDPVNNHCGIYS